jgi:hypothetical protein
MWIGCGLVAFTFTHTRVLTLCPLLFLLLSAMQLNQLEEAAAANIVESEDFEEKSPFTQSSLRGAVDAAEDASDEDETLYGWNPHRDWWNYGHTWNNPWSGNSSCSGK